MAMSMLTRRVRAALMLRDLPKYLTAISQQAGVPPPALDFKYADALSQKDAKTLYEWGQQVPALRAALRDRSHPAYGEVRAFVDLTNWFQLEHPVQANGEPVEWATMDPAARLSPAMRAHLLEGRDLKAADLPPAEAAGVLAWAEERADLRADAMDKSHPQQEQLARELLELHERALAAPAEGAGEGPASDRVVSAEAAAARQAIAAKQGDPVFMKAYCNQFDPRHADAMRAMDELYAKAYPEKPASPSPSEGTSKGSLVSLETIAELQKAPAANPSPPAGFDTRVFKLRQDLAALPKGDPRREPLMAEMEREYAAAYPEPAPAPAGSSTGSL